ncbi:MAG: YheU family protein [Pontibacterium sp.]
MIIPFSALSEEALLGLIEEYVTRDGTDYGEHEISLATKVEQVKAGLRSGELVIYFSEKRETANIIAAALIV